MTEDQPASAGDRDPDTPPVEARAASATFWVLFAVTLMNYLDRTVPAAALGSIQREFGFSDTEAGALATAFLLVYSIAAVPLALWADRGVRKNILALCVAAWSVATLLSAFATGFVTLFAGRALVGIGEAGNAPVGASMLADSFPRAARARVMSRWQAAQLVGTMAGFVLGGLVTARFGWRVAFFACALPGLLCAWLAWRLREPPRGVADGYTAAEMARPEPFAVQVRGLAGTGTVVVATLMQTFAFWVLGAISYWGSVYLQRAYGLSEGQAGVFAGVAFVVPAVIGVLLGGWMADTLTRRYVGGRVLICGVAFALSAPAFALAVVQPTVAAFLPPFVLAALLLNIYQGPVLAAVGDVTPPGTRALALAAMLLLAHLFGDVTSPLVVGGISDALGGGVAGLRMALLLTCPACLLVAGLIAVVGSRVVARDLRRIEARRAAA